MGLRLKSALAVCCAILLSSLALAGDARAQILPSAEPAATEPAVPAEHAKALAEALRDDKVREALIAELERLGAGEQTSEATGAEAPEPKALGRQIADGTRAVAGATVETVDRVWFQVMNAWSQVSGIDSDEWAAILDALINLAWTAAATFTIYMILRAFGKRLYRAIGARAAEADLAGKTVLAVGSVLLDCANVALAWAGGYAVAYFVVGEFGVASLRQTLFLNAFLLTGLVKVALRTLLSPSTSQLRPIDMPDGAARKLSGWLGAVISTLGYGQLLIVPIVSEQVNWFAGQSVGVLVALIALTMFTWLVLSNRRNVAEWLMQAKQMQDGPLFLHSLVRSWHLPLMLYLAVLYMIVLTRPGGVLLPVLGASAQIIAAVLVATMAATAISRLIAKGVSLPDYLTVRLPLLERRLNAFVPKALFIVRLLIAFVVIVYALDTIEAVDIESWFVSRIGVDVTGVVVSVLLLMLAAFLLWLGFSSYVDWRLNPDYGTIPTAREQTLLSLAKNAFSVVLFAVTVMFVLSEIGIDIAPLLASAGVLGLAIGFGAQKMVQDVITGVFIQFENAIDVGDIVQLGGTTGTVERLTIRSVSLRDLHGVFHIIPFSSVDTVSNLTRGFSNYVCDMGIAYREDIDEAKQAMLDAFAEMRQEEKWGASILADIEWFGVQALGDSSVVLRARIRCLPGKQFSIGREYNERLKKTFDARGIEIPFPHQTIYFGEEKGGGAPPAHIVLENRPADSKPANAPEDQDEQQPEQEHAEGQEGEGVGRPGARHPGDVHAKEAGDETER